MRLKHALAFLPVGSLGLIWNRITASRISIFYLAFSVINCIFQVVFQSREFYINQHAGDFLARLTDKGNATFPGFFVLDSQLHLCTHVPNTISTKSCQVVWNGTVLGSKQDDTNTSPHTSSIIPVATTTSSSDSTISVPSSTTLVPSPVIITQSTHHHHDDFNSRRAIPESLHVVETPFVTSDNQTSVILQGFERKGQNVTLDHKCLVALNWPLQSLRNTKREDFAFLAFQVWVLGMSLVALLNESIPHTIAALLTHLSATAWGGFQFYNINTFHRGYTRLITHGACKVNVLPHYWKSSITNEVASLIFNVVALFLSCFLSFRIVKLFGWQTFKRVGASRTINRCYKLVLVLSTVIQLTLFFVIGTAALWIDQLYNGAIGVLTTQGSSNLHQALLVLVLVLLIPWLSTGWFAARLESRFPMMVFLGLSALYLIGLGLMFTSTTFRWTFVVWGFFGSMVFVTGLLILVGLVVGVMCRMNFGKGLPQYLKAQVPLADAEIIQPSSSAGDPSDEKVDFPSTLQSLPSFSAMVGSKENSPSSDQTQLQMGPRFFNELAPPFDRHVDIESSPPSHSSASVTRSKSAWTTFSSKSAPSLARGGSQHSTSSHASDESFGCQWAIE